MCVCFGFSISVCDGMCGRVHCGSCGRVHCGAGGVGCWLAMVFSGFLVFAFRTTCWRMSATVIMTRMNALISLSGN